MRTSSSGCTLYYDHQNKTVSLDKPGDDQSVCLYMYRKT
jgi:hypothetical protein